MAGIGRLIGREMSDVFGDYILKSRQAVEESPRGQSKPKPAASYIKEMQREGVPDEEMRDLGLLDDFDPKKGLERQKLMTKEEMINEIDRRREEKLVGEATVRQVDPYGIATTPDESVDVGTPEFSVNVPDIGDKESYQEIVYSQRGGEQSRLNEALGNDPTRVRDMRGMHFTETDQLFHLRVNRGTTENEERVTNILEIQSDIQQRKQRPPKVEALKEVAAADPDLPMVENWEKLGVKEAIKLALKRGDRYVAVPPGTEIAESVLARETVSEATEAFVTIERGVDPISGKEGDLVTLEPAGINVADRYSIMVEDIENILDESAAKADFSMLDELAGYEVDRDELEPFISLYLRSKVSAYTDRVRFQDRDRQLLSQYEDKLAEMMSAEGIDEPISFIDFMEQYVVSNNVVQELSLLEDEIAEQGAQTAFEIQRRYFVDDVAKELGIPVAQVRKAAQSKEPLTIPEGTGFGGRGLSSFYDETLLSPKRVENYGNFPVVTIKQYRSGSGDLVETQALDLQEYYTNQLLEKENKALSLYSPAAVGLFASYIANKFAFGTQPSEDETPTFEMGGTPTRTFGNMKITKSGDGNAVQITSGNMSKEEAEKIKRQAEARKGMTQQDKKTASFAELDKDTKSTEEDKSAKSKAVVEKIKMKLRSGEITLDEAKELYTKLSAVGGFAEGGMLDEGGTVDPVSGNDVPAGSLQEEVRDDIDAKLSEGEFVFPADVVRYIGLDRLMELRQEAKQGLQKMDDMGQMGNADEAVMPDTVPHEAMEFQQGGIVPASSLPTYLGQTTPTYQQAGAVQTAPKFAGQTQQSTQSVYQPQQFQQVAPIVGQQPATPSQVPAPPQQDAPTSTLPYEMKRFTNAEGNVIYIPFMSGQPQFPIPEGYTEQKRMEAITGEEEKPAETPTETAVKTTQVSDGGGDGPSQMTTGTTKADPVMGIARGFAELNPNSTVKQNVDKYKSAQIKGIAGAALSLLSGSVIGAGVSIYRMNQKMGEYKDAAFAGLPSAVQQQLQVTVGEGQKQYMTTDQFTNKEAQQAYGEAKAAGASDALAAALATSTGAFRGDTSGMDLGGFESSIASEYGTDVGSAQTAMLGQQLEGFTQEELDDFYGQEAPGRGIDAGKLSDFEADVAAYDREMYGIQEPSFAQAGRLGAYDDPSYAGIEAADAPVDRGITSSRTVTRDSAIGSRNVAPGETVSFRSESGRTTDVTGKSYTDASGTTRSGGFVDDNKDGVQQKSERSTVTSGSGSTITSKDGTPVTSRSQADIEAETGSGSSADCFMPHTLITMADGSQKEIKDIVEGDEIMGIYGTTNKVLGIETHEIKREDGYWILSQDDNIDPFFTYNHPFFQEGNLVSFRPDVNKRVNPWLTELTSAWDYFDTVNQSVAPKGTILYNLYLDGDYTLYANGIPFHNIVTNGFITMSLYNTGKITQHDLESDVAYTKTIKNPLVRLGYATIAVPLADEVRKNSFLGKCVSAVCTPFVKGISALSNDKPAPFVKLLGYTFVYPTFMMIGALAQAKGKYS